MTRRRKALDARVADARRRAEDARQEADKSMARYRRVRDLVARPLRQAGENDQFAEIIRDSLTRRR